MVEIYEIETKLNGQEDIIQYHDLISELGLGGQNKVVVDSEKAPIPYKWLNKQQITVIDEICPIRVPIDEYDKEPIPIEVLEHLKKCVKNSYFTHYEIAYTDVDPDPFLIGYLGGYYYSGNTYNDSDKVFIKSKEDYDNMKALGNKHIYGENQYAVARWGAESATWEELTEKAKKSYIKRESKQSEQQIRDAKRNLEDLEKTAFDKFNA